MLLDAIMERLQTQGVAGVAVGWPIGLGELPTEPDTVVAVVETPGEAPDAVDGMERPHFQVHVRGEPDDYQVAHARARQIYGTLHGIGGLSIDGTQFVGLWALQSPFLLARDDARRPHFVCNFRVIAHQ